MTTLKPVTRTTMSEQVAMQIAAMISEGLWKPDDKLPSEAELCRILKVGRSTLREALKMISFVGIVRMRAGWGTYVNPTYKQHFKGMFAPRVPAVEEKTVLDICEARLILECELAAFCAERATEEELHNLENIVTQLQSHDQLSEERILDLDMSFHLGIAAGSKNQVLVQAYESVHEYVAEFARKTQRLQGSHERMHAQHAAIFSALKERNPSKARAMMRKHVRTSKETFELLFEASKDKAEAPDYAMDKAG
jgi:GntR family transcriptional repressor for pyruvate dehydrogenase complex